MNVLVAMYHGASFNKLTCMQVINYVKDVDVDRDSPARGGTRDSSFGTRLEISGQDLHH